MATFPNIVRFCSVGTVHALRRRPCPGAAAVLFASLLAVVQCSRGPDYLTDRDASRVVETFLQHETMPIALGPVVFHSGNDTSEGSAPVKLYPIYRAFAAAELIVLADETDLSQGFSGWENFLATTQHGAVRAARVSLTAKGAKVAKMLGSEQRLAEFVVGEHDIKKIVSNEVVEAPGEKYRVVMGTEVTTLAPAVAEPLSKVDVYSEPHHRFRALLKFDPFASTWQVQTIDFGPKDGEFFTSRVPHRLQELQAKSPR